MKHGSESEYFVTVECELADRPPFGNAQHINDLNDRRCLHRLSLIEGIFPAALEVLEELRGLPAERRHYFIRDPTLRIGVDQALLHTKALPAQHTLDWTERLLSRAVSLLKSHSKPAPLEAEQCTSVSLGEQLLRPFVWQDPNSDLCSQCIQSLIHEFVPDAHVDCPSEENIRTLQAAVKLLDRLLPRLTPSVLNHVIAVVIISERGMPGCGHRGFRSGTTSSLPGVMVLSASELATPWRAAESLLHESLHLKFIDLEFTHSMNLKASDEADLWTIRPPWINLSDRNDGWPPIRAMTAAHVYMGLALFFRSGQMLATNSDTVVDYPASELQEATKKVTSRAQYLVGELDARLQSLGPAGQYFVTWLKWLLAKPNGSNANRTPRSSGTGEAQAVPIGSMCQAASQCANETEGSGSG